MYHLVLLEIQRRVEELERQRERLSESQNHCLNAVKERLPRQLNRAEVEVQEFAAINALMIEGNLWLDPPAKPAKRKRV